MVRKWNFFAIKMLIFEKFVTTELKTFINDNDCWINSIKDKNLIYIHTYNENFSIEQDTKVFF